MVGVAQLVERRLVVADVAGSKPVTHPHVRGPVFLWGHRPARVAALRAPSTPEGNQRRYDGRNRCDPNVTRRATHVSGPHPRGRGPIFAVVGCWLAGHPPDVGLRLA